MGRKIGHVEGAVCELGSLANAPIQSISYLVCASSLELSNYQSIMVKLMLALIAVESNLIFLMPI
jgi:hypothetical protein